MGDHVTFFYNSLENMRINVVKVIIIIIIILIQLRVFGR